MHLKRHNSGDVSIALLRELQLVFFPHRERRRSGFVLLQTKVGEQVGNIVAIAAAIITCELGEIAAAVQGDVIGSFSVETQLMT